MTCKYLREFSEKFETVLMGYSGAGEKLIHEKKQKQKSRDTFPLKKQLDETDGMVLNSSFILIFWNNLLLPSYLILAVLDNRLVNPFPAVYNL